MFKHHVWIVSQLSKKWSGGSKFESQFWASLGAWVFYFVFCFVFLLHGFSPATLISSIHKHVRLIFSQYPWLRHCLKVWMESLGDAQWLSTVPQWLVRGRGHWCAGSLCQANWKHCPLIGLICENRLICSSSDGVDPFTMPLVCICLCVSELFPMKRISQWKHSHTLFLVLWAIKHCSEPSQLITTRHGAGSAGLLGCISLW